MPHFAEKTAYQCLDLLPTPHNFHTLEGYCAFWQILQHSAGPLLQQPLSGDEQHIWEIISLPIINDCQYKSLI